MHFLMGELVEVYEENGVRMGKVRVGGSITRVVLEFLPEARIGERVFVHAGFALSRLGLVKMEGSPMRDAQEGDHPPDRPRRAS